MDDLRSLQGLSSLLQNSKKPKNKVQHALPQISRAVSLMPKKKNQAAVDIIKHVETKEKNNQQIHKSYSSRGHMPYHFDIKEGTDTDNVPPSKAPEMPVPTLSNLSQQSTKISVDNVPENRNMLSIDSATPAHPKKMNSNYLSIDSFMASEDECDDDPFELLHQLSERSAVGPNMGDLGLNALDIGLVDDHDEEDGDGYENEWYNDYYLQQNQGLTVDTETDEKLMILESPVPSPVAPNIDLAIPSFPSDEFKDYPASSASKKEHGSNVHIIGSGSFGIVIKSFHLKSCATVAIKECRITENEKILSLFIQEAKYYEQFKASLYVIDILGFGRKETNNKLCIALEYMDRQSLSQINSALDESHVKYISFCILNALKEIHSAKCIHNDVKPDNILINARGDVKLTDFGCCFTMENTFMTDKICGSKQYYAPEKWLATPPKYDTKSDIWSFGITLYEIMTVTQKSERDNGFYEAPSFEALSGSYSDELCAFVKKMFVYDYHERWSAAQLLQHQYLKSKEELNRKAFGQLDKKAEDEMKFMITSLIEYNSNQHWTDEASQHNEMYSDQQKMDNLCKHSGYTEKEVKALIKFAVGNAKRKMQKH